jgi:hypothetical protein
MIGKWLAAGIAGMLLFSTGAGATTYSFDLSFAAGAISVTNAVLTSTVDNSGVYTISGASGTIVDGATSYTISGPSGYAGADNLLSIPTTPFVDGSGISLAAANGPNALDLNISSYIFRTTTGYDAYYQINLGGITSTDFSALTVTSATPLPAALPLFATGLGAFGFLVRRRKRKIALATA